MRDRTLKQWVVAAALVLLLPCAASAAGLGRLTVLSSLGQPLNAEVELLSVQKGETITARLASPEVYQQAGAQYNNALTGTRVTLERRPSGEPYLKVTTSRPIGEPFLELLIEINSENGRVLRQYTALLDPPGYGRAVGEAPPPARAPEPTPPVAATPVAPAPPPAAEGPLAAPERPAPAAPAPKSAARAPSAAPPAPSTAPATGAAQKRYGPVKPGETLRKIARAVRPEGVSLEQTLVGLYRQNPDAFINKNMNLMKSGKILRVPEANEIAALARDDATQEVRMQVADFNAYRNRVADRPATAPEEGSVRSGRIGTRVAERGAPEGPRDTVRISRGEPPAKGKAAGMNTAERLRALEEEVIAREKALAEANERISQLEQIIKDTQRAIELKAAGGQKGAEKSGTASQPGSSAVAVAPPTAPAAKPQEAAPPAKAAPPEQTPTPPAAEAQKPPAPAEAPTAATPAPAPKPKAAPPSEPPKEPSFMSTLLDEPLYLAAGGAAILLGGLAFMVMRRRRQDREDVADPDDAPHIAPTLGGPGVDASEEIRAGSSTIERAAARADIGAAPALSRAEPGATPVATRTADVSVPSAAQERAVASTPVSPAPAPAAPTARTGSDDNDLDFNLADERAAALGLTKGNAQRDAAARGTEPSRDRDDPSHEFKLDPLPPIDAPMDMEKVASDPPPSVDFKLDLNDLDVNAPAGQSSVAGRDGHWHDVQQKFDLAKAYQEMGDRGGARNILQEVLREGDGDQQAQAKKLLDSLS